jgi:hypothetical protein
MKTLLVLSLLLLFVPASAQSTGSGGSSVPPAVSATPPAKPVASPLPSSLQDAGAQDVTPNATKTPVAPGAKGEVILPIEKKNPITIPRFDKPPVIDGNLNDPVWQSAVTLKDFYQIDPGDNTAPSKPTEVMIGYDPKFLYIAFRAFDEPDKVRSTVAKRDNIFSDDYVGFYLDTFNDQRRAFEIFFNPLGIQGDGVLTEGQGEDFSVDLLLESKGIIGPEGYTVEIAIPFKSLRYEAGKGKLWGAHFFRRIQRFNRELDSWMPFSRNNSGNMSQAGHLAGLEGIAAERTIELIPSLTLSESGRFVRSFTPPVGVVDPGRMVNEPLKFDPGLTAKFTPSSALTLDLAINPDFAQVEADQIVVTTNQRFPIFFAEKRPFFLEGIDIFRTPISAVHTRAIVDPDIAVKLSGKRGPDTFGLMLATDNGPGNLSADDRGSLINCQRSRQINPAAFCRNENIVDKNAYIGVLRLKHDIGKSENTIGILATSYNFIEKHNQLAGFDGRFKPDQKSTFSFQLLGTTSRNFFYDPETNKNNYRTGKGLGYSAGYSVSGRNFGWELYGEGFTKDYRADTGFFGRTNTNFNSFFTRYDTDPDPKKKVISRHVHNFSWIGYDFQGRIQNWESEFYVEWRLPRNSYFSLAYEPAYERILEEEFGPKRTATRKGAFFGEDDERSVQKHHFFIAGNSQWSKKVQFNSRAVWRRNHLDLDFGGGRRYPRVSPPAILARLLEADKKCPDAKGVFDAGCFPALDPGAGNLFELTAGVTYQPTNELRMSLNLTKQRLVRKDTGLTAFDINLLTFRGTYQFTRATFARAIIDYNTLSRRARAQLLAGWTPSPGTSFYVGYNDDMNYSETNPFTAQIVPGFRRNSRTYFVKMSYLFRKSFGS